MVDISLPQISQPTRWRAGPGITSVRLILGAALILAFLLAIGWSRVDIIAEMQSPISCQRHHGAFSDGFSPDFDIDRVDCRFSWIDGSPDSPVLARLSVCGHPLEGTMTRISSRGSIYGLIGLTAFGVAYDSGLFGPTDGHDHWRWSRCPSPQDHRSACPWEQCTSLTP